MGHEGVYEDGDREGVWGGGHQGMPFSKRPILSFTNGKNTQRKSAKRISEGPWPGGQGGGLGTQILYVGVVFPS